MTNKFIEQRVEALENELSELKLIVAQIRKPSTVVEEALTQQAETIEFEGKQYKKVDREAREGDVVIVKKLGFNNSAYIETEKPYLVLLDSMITDEDSSGYKGTFYVYDASYGRTPETVDVYELIVEDKPFFVPKPAKTTNQLRAEIIEKAKGFVEKYLNACKSIFATHEGNGLLSEWGMTPKFEINLKKRAVVVLLYRTYGGDLVGKGIAKCDPSDVFNEHIGKAIALGRALGLDVSEFEQAVQPDKFEVGQVISFHSLLGVLENEKLTKVKGKELWMDTGWISSDRHEELEEADKPKIINDTNAIYSEVTK